MKVKPLEIKIIIIQSLMLLFWLLKKPKEPLIKDTLLTSQIFQTNSKTIYLHLTFTTSMGINATLGSNYMNDRVSTESLSCFHYAVNKEIDRSMHPGMISILITLRYQLVTSTFDFSGLSKSRYTRESNHLKLFMITLLNLTKEF